MSKLVRRKQLLALTSAYFKEITRERGVLFWGIVFPILMSLGLGVAFTKKADVVRKVAVIESGSAANALPDSTAAIETFLRDHATEVKPAHGGPSRFKFTIPDEKLGNTTFVFEHTSWQKATVLLKRGNVAVAIGEKDGRITYHFDPRNPDAQLTYLKLSRLFGGGETAAAAGAEGVEPLTVIGTRYIDFLIPGLIAMGIMMSCLWGLSYSIVEKRTKKLLRRMVATPMRKSHFLVAQMTVRIGMNVVESALLFIFAWLAFHISIQGDVSALFVIFLAGNIAFAGISILVSARTANTEIANGLINAVVMPMMVLSGVFFSYHNFPEWSIPFIQRLPLTLLADGMRSVFIEGAGYADIIVPSLILTVIGVLFFAAGLKIFKWS